VGTHGRSFWILDDLTPLRQLNDQIAKASVHLFVPQEALRWRWNRNPDTPLPPEVPAGTNPPDGAIIDYFLSAHAQGPVTLEILDATGALVRRYASTDQPPSMEKLASQHPIPMYWVRPTQILSTEPGMHRFVWDLHYAPPEALEHEFPISAIVHNTPLRPLGAWPLPGTYAVKLTVDGKSYTQPLTLKMDPRIQTPLDDLRKQQEMELGAVTGMNESYKALERVKSVRGQLKALAPGAKGQEKLAEGIAVLDKLCVEFEGETRSAFYGVPANGKRPENFSTLNQHFAALLAVADSADVAPTTQAATTFKEIQAEAQALHDRWNAVRGHELAELNKDLKKAGLTEIDPDKPLGEKLGGAPDGDDEP
jgi:hypothetical protein